MTTDVRASPSREARACTVYSALAEGAARHGDRELLRSESQSIDYGGLHAGAEVDAGRLAALGIGAGDRVVLWLPNGPRWASLFFACARIGAVAVTAGTRLRTVDIRHMLADSGARALAYVPEAFGTDYARMVAHLLRDRARGALPAFEYALAVAGVPVGGGVMLDSLQPAPLPEVWSDGSSPAVVCYTSGTTGRPKGCVHAHATLVRNGEVAARLSELGPRDRILCPVPFAHIFGFHMGLLQATLSGATLINGEPYEPDRVLDLAERERATVLYLVPAMASEVVSAQRRRPRDLSCLRQVLLAGSAVSPELRQRVGDRDAGLGAEIAIVYGCTEAPTLTQLLPSDPSPQRAASVGRPTPGVELRVVLADGTDAGTGEIGEVVARGYNTMIGYLGDPDATAAKYRDDWLATGDLGWLDAAGFLHLVGRASDVFDVGGFNAYPREIEAQLEDLEGVIEVAVIGVPDKRLGHVPMAWITTASSALNEQDVIVWSREHMASYKRPRHVRIVESLPRTATGKLARVRLEQLARRALPQLQWESDSR